MSEFLGSRSGNVNLEEIRRRWIWSWEAYEDLYTKYDLINLWLFAFERHLRNGEEWATAFRFPELYGQGQRKFDNLIASLPEIKIRGYGNDVIQLQGAYDHLTRISNLDREKFRAIYDAVYFGRGALYIGTGHYCKEVHRLHKDGNKKKGSRYDKMMYDGLMAERVDPRDLIPAYSANILHDHTGSEYCPYVFRRRILHYTTFLARYGDDPMFKNIDQVQGTTYAGAFFGDSRRVTKQEAQEKTAQNDYVSVMEYWDQEQDVLKIFANTFDIEIYDSPVGIPFSHKQLPFHFYYNYRRWDSITGIGEVELNMPYNLFRERIMNLMIDNITLELQPAYIIDGDIGFNEQEEELQAGAIFTVRGLSGGKLQDHIMPYRVGGVTADVPSVISTVESSQIAATGDDVRALYENPAQLATQTMAKREAMNKRINSNIMRNTTETEFYLANQIVSLIKNELSEPYKDEMGKTKFRKIKIQGYDIVQNKPDEEVERIEPIEGAQGEFYLNEDVSKGFDDKEIEIVPARLDEQLKKDNIERLMSLLQTVMNVAQFNPALLQGMDIMGWFKMIAQEMGIDMEDVFPILADQEGNIDVIDQEYDEIAVGRTPEVKSDKYDLMERYQKAVEFEKSKVYEDLPAKSKKALQEFKSLILTNAVSQAGKTQGATGGVGGVGQAGQQGAVPLV